MKNDNLNFFIVDDDPFSAAIFRQYLIFEGYKQIHVFNNGNDCLESLDEEPDVIILDHFMSPLNGIDVLTRVMERKPGIYVIYVSSGNDASLISSSLQKGAFCYIVKGENELDLMIKELGKIQQAIKQLKTGAFAGFGRYTLTYNRNAFSLN
jgi:response regulator of citrate/malate metabolism